MDLHGTRERVAPGIYKRHAKGCKQGERAVANKTRSRCACDRWIVTVGRRQQTIVAKTLREAREPRDSMRKEFAIEVAALKTGGGQTVDQVAAMWLREEALHLRGKSLQRLNYDYESRVAPVFGDRMIASITLEDVEAWGDSVRKLDIAASSKRKAYGVLRSLFRFAVSQRLVSTDVATPALANQRIPKQKPTKRNLWSSAHIDIALGCEEIAVRHRAMIAILVTTGLRRAELAGLRLCDVIDGSGALSVTVAGQIEWLDGKPPLRVDVVKTHPADRTVELATKAASVVQLHMSMRRSEGAGDDDLLFPGCSRQGLEQPLASTAIGAALRRACARAGVPPIAPHGLRHTTATIALKKGALIGDLAATMGHANPDVTLKTYAQAVQSRPGGQLAVIFNDELGD